MAEEFRSGYVNIIGMPNMGKSTLLNALMSEKLAIVSPKAQTTRQRILGILNGDNYQMVFSDTPGIVKEAKYKLHRAMQGFVEESLEDADVIFLMTDVFQQPEEMAGLVERLNQLGKPFFVLLNKIDLKTQEETGQLQEEWKALTGRENVIPLSAIMGYNVLMLKDLALKYLPVHPAYFPEDQLTDKTERHLASEIIREKIFMNYRQEIPYSSEVAVTSFKEEGSIIRIAAEIYVERPTQKGIIIGRGGEALKKTGTEARMELEKVFQKKIYLELFVKVKEDWRDDERSLQQFGYES